MVLKGQGKRNLIFYMVLGAGVASFLAVLFVMVFSGVDSGKVRCYDDEYRAILEEVYPNIECEKGDVITEFREFEKEQSIVTYAQIGEQIAKANDKYVFIPQCKETVVIAIDRDLTSDNVQGYRELFDSGKDISLFLGKLTALDVWGYEEANHIYASLAFGLYGEYDIKALAKDLDVLEDNGKFFVNERKPFMIMTDRQAVALKKQGQNIDIVLPSDGTHTFVRGILTSKDMETDTVLLQEKLVKNGYMTMENQADWAYYPSVDCYSVAKEVSDVASYHKAIASVGKIIRRSVFDTKRYGCAINTDRAIVFVILSSLIIVYIATLDKRVKQNDIKVAIMFSGFAQIGLMSSYVLRMMLYGVANTLLWYAYYLFFGILSMSFLYIALNVGMSKTTAKREKIKNVGYYIYLAMTSIWLLFIMTNDLHLQVFDNIYKASGVENYSYNWGYYVTCVVIYLPVVFSIATLINKARKSPRKFAMIYPCVAVVALFVHGVLYVLNVPICRDLDIAFATTFYSWLIMESCLRTGLIPTNVGYNKLFGKSKLKMQIVTSNGRVVNSYVSDANRSDTLEIRNELQGGEFVYYKDIKEINSIKNQLASTIDRLKKNNEMLKKENKIKQELAKTVATEQIYLQINEIIRQDKRVIAKLLKEMETATSKADYIARINILATGIKRKSMLKIDSVSGQVLDAGVLHSSIDEIRHLVKNTNLKFSSICRLKNALPSSDSILEIYTIYLKMIDNALLKGARFVFVQLLEEADIFALSFTVDKQILADTEIENLKNNTKVTIKQSRWEENSVVQLSLRKGGEA